MDHGCMIYFKTRYDLFQDMNSISSEISINKSLIFKVNFAKVISIKSH